MRARSTWIRLASVLLVALFAVGVTACGATSKADYKAQVKKIGDRVQKDTKGALNGSGQPSSKQLKDAQTSLNKAADDLDDITPPSDVKQGHEDLVKAVRAMARYVGTLSDAMATIKKDPSKASGLLDKIDPNKSQDVKDATKYEKAAEAEFKKHGYGKLFKAPS